MKKLFEKHFERTWLIIFFIMFLLIMIPFPFFYSERYIPAFGGIPVFLFGWFAHTAVTFALIIVYYKMCMKRKEYHLYDDESEANVPVKSGAGESGTGKSAAAESSVTKSSKEANSKKTNIKKEDAQHGRSN